MAGSAKILQRLSRYLGDYSTVEKMVSLHLGDFGTVHLDQTIKKYQEDNFSITEGNAIIKGSNPIECPFRKNHSVRASSARGGFLYRKSVR